MNKKPEITVALQAGESITIRADKTDIHINALTEEEYEKDSDPTLEEVDGSLELILDRRGNLALSYGDGSRGTVVAKTKSPLIVVLCGSTRFISTFAEQNLKLTLEGIIVLSVGAVAHSDSELGLDEETKARLDELHKRKIDIADEVFVLNVGGYIGSSTRSEIEYAQGLGKVIRYLEPR